MGIAEVRSRVLSFPNISIICCTQDCTSKQGYPPIIFFYQQILHGKYCNFPPGGGRSWVYSNPASCLEFCHCWKTVNKKYDLRAHLCSFFLVHQAPDEWKKFLHVFTFLAFPLYPITSILRALSRGKIPFGHFHYRKKIRYKSEVVPISMSD